MSPLDPPLLPTEPVFIYFKFDEKIDFTTIRGVFNNLEDQCIRLLGLLEEAHYQLEDVSKEAIVTKNFTFKLSAIKT
jgi:hypothetical protein